MNLDTDMQWAFWDGVHDYYKGKKDYLQSQLGNLKVMINQIRNFTILGLGYALEKLHLLID